MSARFKKNKRSRSRLQHNLRPTIVLLLIPLAVGFATIGLIVSGLYYNHLADIGTKRLVTGDWEYAQAQLVDQQTDYQRKLTYYKVKLGQTLGDVAEYYSVSPQRLQEMNPGVIAAGVTIKVPPLEKPLDESPGSNNRIGLAVVEQDGDMLRIENKYNKRQPIITNIPELASFLAPYGVFEQVEAGVYRLKRAISIDENIRVDVTTKTIKRLELVSKPGLVTCLCFDSSIALFDGVQVSSVDPDTGAPDLDYDDGRSFVRMKNGRLDAVNTEFRYLGGSLEFAKSGVGSMVQREGGVYGVSWRISDDGLGKELATGWVENSVFDRNHFGAYTYGVSGMTWRGNTFTDNDVYGLDPHDDSNNALIEQNVFRGNGKHGFIVSKRCNYNIIRNNISVDNDGHGFMLHQDSAYNIIQGNIAARNSDNFAIYESNHNTVKNNESYSPRLSHVRVNKPSYNSYIIHNKFYGGTRGVYLYDGVSNAYVADNFFYSVDKKLQTTGASNVLFVNNRIDNIKYDIAVGDGVIYGPNVIDKDDTKTLPTSDELMAHFEEKLQSQNL